MLSRLLLAALAFACCGVVSGQSSSSAYFTLRNFGGPPYANAFSAGVLWGNAPRYLGGYASSLSSGSAPINSVQTSYDFGVTWGGAPSPGTGNLPAPCAAGASFALNATVAGVVCGYGAGNALTNTVYLSGDLSQTTAWQTEQGVWSPRAYLSAAKFAAPFDGNGTVVFFGGLTASGPTNDVYARVGPNSYVSVAAGNTAGNAIPFSARYGHSTVSDAAGSLVVLAGGISSSGAYLNDVWSANWVLGRPLSSPSLFYNLLTAAAPFAARFAASVWLANDQLYIGAGRISNGQALNDVWSSPDYGTSWNQVTSGANFAPRYGAAVVALGRKVLLYGGTASQTATPFQDVWIGFQ